MLIIDAAWFSTCTRLDQCPPGETVEIAFIGRSNVGKSSLINMLVNKKGLAKTSSNPGKTQTINHFIITPKHQPKWFLVDLPGYGYAKISKSKREDWVRMIRKYLNERETLACICVLIDIRHKPQQVDLEFMDSLVEKELPFVVILTKSDKLGEKTIASQVELFESTYQSRWADSPNIIVSSADKAIGKERILDLISSLIDHV
jgi:GTP-binding protein